MRSSPFILPVAAAVAVFTAVGCGNTFVVTDSFTPPTTGFLASPPDSLHDYVTGSVVELDVRASRAFVDMNAVQVVSKNDDILSVTSQSVKDAVIHVVLQANAPGTASLDFLDDRQRPLEERVVKVKQPDEIDLDINIDTNKGFTIPVITGDDLLLAVGGTVTFRVTYKADSSELKGKGVLSGVSATIASQNPTLTGPDREFLSMVGPPGEAAASDVLLQVAGITVRTLHVRIAPPTEIATIQLDEGELPAWKNNGDVYTVWAKAFTADATPLFGTEYAWTFDSAPVTGTGDLVSYTYQGGERRRIQVGSGDAVADVTVEAKEGTAAVGSTSNPGCASSGGVPLAATLLVLGLRRRRPQVT